MAGIQRLARIWKKRSFTKIQELAVWIKHLVISVFIAGVLSAPLVLPLAEFSGLSTRSLMSVEDNLSFSLSPIQLFGFLAPNFGGYAEWTVYFGGMFLLIIIWILTHRELRKVSAFWLLVLICYSFTVFGSIFSAQPMARPSAWNGFTAGTLAVHDDFWLCRHAF